MVEYSCAIRETERIDKEKGPKGVYTCTKGRTSLVMRNYDSRRASSIRCTKAVQAVTPNTKSKDKATPQVTSKGPFPFPLKQDLPVAPKVCPPPAFGPGAFRLDRAGNHAMESIVLEQGSEVEMPMHD